MDENTITANVVLSEREQAIVNGLVERLGLGNRGFSAAVRIIIREWAALKNPTPQPAQPEPTQN